MNIKGTAAGGGNALLIPMTEFSMGLTGDINNIMNAHNLAMVAMTARMQHERNYNDEQLKRLTRMRRVLDIDPNRVEMGWIIDFCAQAMRNIIIGIGGRMEGYMMQSKFGIAVSSEVMAILSIVNDQPICVNAWTKSRSPSTRKATRLPPATCRSAGP